MSIKLSAASFLNGVGQSGLVPADKLAALQVELKQAGVDCQDSSALAKGLIERGALTAWQAGKLLEGRHKGFLLGRYKLLGLLGSGQMSSVFLAEHTLMERRCAIKVLPANKVRDTSYLGRFHQEAKVVAALDHPNIVRAFDVDQQVEGAAEIHFLVMEFVSGINLEKRVQEQGPLDFVTAADIIRQAADGLSHAHLHGVVHRDIKPENLLLDRQGVVKLLDMGLARYFKTTAVESLTLKHDEKVLGTADYLAPEQAVDSHKVDERADIYSLGCSLYYALTGHPPFTEGTLVQRLLAHQTKLPPSVKVDRPDVPESLLEILERMMAKRAADRFQTAADVRDAMGRWLLSHGNATWKEKNLSVMASLIGLAAIEAALARPAAQPPKREPPTVAPVDPAKVNPEPAPQSAKPDLPVEVRRPATTRELPVRTHVPAPPRAAAPTRGTTAVATRVEPAVATQVETEPARLHVYAPQVESGTLKSAAVTAAAAVRAVPGLGRGALVLPAVIGGLVTAMLVGLAFWMFG